MAQFTGAKHTPPTGTVRATLQYGTHPLDFGTAPAPVLGETKDDGARGFTGFQLFLSYFLRQAGSAS